MTTAEGKVSATLIRRPARNRSVAQRQCPRLVRSSMSRAGRQQTLTGWVGR